MKKLRFYAAAKVVLAPIIKFFMHIRIKNRENEYSGEGGLVICSNHLNMLDCITLAVSFKRQIRFLGKKELFRIPVLKNLLSMLGAYGVDRGGADVGAVKKTISILSDGATVGIFPQGTRHPGVDPAKTSVKHGVGMITWHAKTTVVPAYIRAKGNRVRFFRKTELVLGEPIPFDAFAFEKGGKTEYVAATEKIFSAVCALGGYERALPDPQAEEQA